MTLCLTFSSADYCWKNTLQSEGFEDDAALDETIRKLEADLRKARKKDDDSVDEIVVRPITILGSRCPLDITI